MKSTVYDVLEIAMEAKQSERVRIIGMFRALAEQFRAKSEENDDDAALAFVAAASCVDRVCDEAAVS